MGQVLYRKYRPQTFDEIVGQDHITDLLKSALSKDKKSHAYLFVGPRGLGKTSTARILAKALNCKDLDESGNPCNECENCLGIMRGGFYDLIEIDAASNRGIDEIRDLKERVSYQPSQGKYKVYIIDEVHMLTREAFNALLKLLEEPPKHVVFILATTEVHKIPATVLSRCQRYDFRLGDDEKVKKYLNRIVEGEKVEVADEAMDVIISKARGSYRDGASLLDVVLSGEEKEKIDKAFVNRALGIPDDTMVYYFLENIVKGDHGNSLDMLQEVYSKGIDLNEFVHSLIEVLKVYVVDKSTGKKDSGMVKTYEFLKAWDLEKLVGTIKRLIQAQNQMQYASVPTLPLEMLVLDVQVENNGLKTHTIKSEQGSDTVEDSVKSEQSSNTAEDSVKSKQSSDTKDNVKSEESSDTVEDSVKSEHSSDSESRDLTKLELQKKWKEFMKEIRDHNGHLYAFLNQATINECKENQLIISVGFSFHKERITSTQSKHAIQESFNKVFGFSPRVVCKVDTDTGKKATEELEQMHNNISKKAQSDHDDGKRKAPKKPKKKKKEKGGDNITNKIDEVFGEL